MKVLLISYPRTRGTILIEAISKFYGIKNLYEEMAISYEPSRFIEKSLFPKQENIWNIYKKDLKNYNDNLLLSDNFAIKLYPSCFINTLKCHPETSREPNYTLDRNDFLDLDFYFNLSKYDKIFLVYRKDYIDAVLSYLHARKRGFFNIKEPDRIKNHPSDEEYNVWFYSNNKQYENWTIRNLILQTSLTPYIESYLKLKNLQYTKLEYSEIVDYIKINYPENTFNYLDNNYDYKNGTKNHLDLISKLESIKKDIDSNLLDIFPNYRWKST